MKTPEFWYRPPGLAALLLAPLSLVWRLGGKLRRRFARPKRIGALFILVGNVVAGGAGKTPVVLALARKLQHEGQRVHIIAKGYGGSLRGPVRVDPVFHNAKEVGDEPLLLAEAAPTWVGRDRLATAEIAAIGADVVISDDGLQNPDLLPDITFLVMDGVAGFGNGRVMPAGPLREPLANALSRATAVVQIGGNPRDLGCPRLMADMTPREAEWMKNANLVPFAGIGRPEKFFATCTTSGGKVISTFTYPDHHIFTDREMEEITKHAADSNAVAVTTAKDFVRVPPLYQPHVRVVRVGLDWREPAALNEIVHALIKPKHAPGHLT